MIDYKSASAVPYNEKGFWLGKFEKGYAAAEAAAFNEEMAVDAPLVDRDAQQQAAHATARPSCRGTVRGKRASVPERSGPRHCHL